ncbi:Ppx/GppA phosphatase family protein [Algoriphagus zhangzhouensis]|uniref:Exopolyphosphatase / guanosine-5'-triphosphate,3'-diphosphate pyrophosphatase n=1 Tax=Algoriphagus zhangzhouensis TaxID=1073327 RepID=A0A1M7ZGX9_9BACT|nr:Ppx/GppA phosphatase family protein [Algoriphagus zhangzhouensis]TDY44639.1 exopolyphosphatase/guanosine-5'-triphosphate,3'-diphosphate pyrophosphatase [Algoriphagus zhangzhouensis]SHO64069.1 exopolyphosphatase / guanosine-5'-triphosphate,3'-diphosphate pyrophosphatase [Algoriphagus zhangzhouensis]
MSTRKAAVIDMGTNTFHLLLVEISNGDFKTIYKEKIPVKLGQGGINQDQIAPDALKRAYHTLRHFRNLIDGEKIEHIFAFATSAVRNAKNGSEFVQEVKKTLDIDINVISGKQEAQLIYEGIKLSGSLNGQTELMMDIGGGSVEFIIGTSQEAFWKESFEIGGQRLLELFHHHDPILPEEVLRLYSYLEEKLAPLLEAIQQFKPTSLVGASGTFDTLTDIYFESMLQCKLTGQHVFELPSEEFHRIHQMLVTMDRAERLKIPGMIPMRVDMIVVASTLIDFILRYIPVQSITCSHYALKEGAISTLLTEVSSH